MMIFNEKDSFQKKSNFATVKANYSLTDEIPFQCEGTIMINQKI